MRKSKCVVKLREVTGIKSRKKGKIAGIVAAVIAVIGIVCVFLKKEKE